MLKLKRPLVFLDLETTGTDVAKDRIVEIAFVKMNVSGEVETLPSQENARFLIHPNMNIPIESSLVHGIYDEDVVSAPKFSECAHELMSFIDGCDLAGFNSNKFDIPLLAEEFLRAGVYFSLDNRHTVDVQVLFHQLEPRNLTAAVNFYCNKDLPNAHAALVDTLATKDVLLGMFQKYENTEKALPVDVEELEKKSLYRKRADLIGNLVYNDQDEMVFGFGKHKGVSVKDVFAKEPGYYSWMMNADFPLYTKEVLRTFKESLQK
jgi:DNA polymerase-3 subunit epsilon